MVLCVYNPAFRREKKESPEIMIWAVYIVSMASETQDCKALSQKQNETNQKLLKALEGLQVQNDGLNS